ncbi:hypothetical protein N0V86_001060 [Didymella sp. IMI 355093]|nr:hypothetical protein N0V86_001060 [Didymella sp. IMI 355093]
MALTLRPWLHQDVQDQLRLGHSWLVEKTKAKAKLTKPSASVDKKWEGLYHDNGSCLDIIVPFCPEQAHVLVLKALNRSNEIASILQLIQNARAKDDDRCLRLHAKEEEDVDAGYTMAGADETFDEHASMNTQMPFGTQLQHPIRSRRSEDEVAFSPPRHHPYSTPRPGSSVHNVTTASPRPKETPGKRANREGMEELIAQASQTPQEKGKKRVRETETESPSTHSAKKTSFSEDQPKRSHASKDRFAAECSWMKGLTLNRATATVPDDQGYLLNKPESWSKQSKFPPANIPTALFTILSRTVDEKAALEGATSSGSFHETPSSGSYPANSAPQPTDEQDSESEDEAPTSPVSWQTSPSPEPPQRPTLPRQGLPPDSSLEMPENVTEAAEPQKPAVRREQPPPYTLPAPSHQIEEELPPSSPPAQLAALDSDDDMDMETSVPQALGEDLSQPTAHLTQNDVPHTETRPRSVVQVKETPYMKSKNGQQPVMTVCPPTQESVSHSSSASIVRGTYYPELSSSAIEETRLEDIRKDNDTHRQGDTSADLQVEIQDAQILPDGDAQDKPMFDMFVHDDPPLEPILRDDSEKQARSPQADITQVVHARPEPIPMSAQLPPKDSSSGEQLPSAAPQAAMPVPMHPERRPSRQPSDTPSLPKRKHAASPIQDRKRGTKAKRPKYAFGNKDPETLIRERKESLQIERQKSTTSAESRQGSVSNVPVQQNSDTKMKDLDTQELVEAQIEEANASAAGGMSPRHQSLYASPSPVLRPVAAPPAADAAIQSISLDQSAQVQQGTLAGQTTDRDVPTEPAAKQHLEALPPSENLPEPEPELQERSSFTSAPVLSPQPTTIPPAQEVRVRTEQVSPGIPGHSSASLTVFEKFKTAYPEYKASSKHFANQCKLIDELDREDRMVPKWMWDDFIVRNRIDYAQYAADCIDSGEEPMKYIRFYKDTIRDAIFKKGVIEARATLEKALQELGVQPPVTKAPAPGTLVQQAAQQPTERPSRPAAHQFSDARQARRVSAHQSPRPSASRPTYSPTPPPQQPAVTPPKKKASRKSLPFTVPSSAGSSRVNGTAHIRHSLPASSSRTAPTSTPAQTALTRPAPITQQKSRSSLGNSLRFYKSQSSASPLETGTGNEYRDFIKAQEALTATTGSKRVSSTPAPRKY